MFGTVVRLLGKAALGAEQERALRSALYRAADGASRLHPQLSQISAEIELLGDEAVVREIVAASAAPAALSTWPAAAARWHSQFGESPPPKLNDYLQAWAELLRAQLPWSTSLHSLWTAQAVAQIQQSMRERDKASAASVERERRSSILRGLHAEWLAGRDGLSPSMIAGTEPLPEEWVATRLGALGEPWRQVQYIPSRGADEVNTTGADKSA